MILNLNDDQFLENPNEETIRTAIVDLGTEQFAILSQADEEYVQTYHNADGTYQLEFRAGSFEEHYGVDPESISVKDVQDAFAAYNMGRKDWNKVWEWERESTKLNAESDNSFHAF